MTLESTTMSDNTPSLEGQVSDENGERDNQNQALPTTSINGITDLGEPAPMFDPFSPESLLLSQKFHEITPTRKLITNLRVGKPPKDKFVRASTNPDHTIYGSVIELGDLENEVYWVLPRLRESLAADSCFKNVALTLSTTRDGAPFFWKIALPDPNGKRQIWISSMKAAQDIAKDSWVRVSWSPANRAYEVITGSINIAPDFPTESIQELMNIAFNGKIITDLNHPVIKSLKGQE